MESRNSNHPESNMNRIAKMIEEAKANANGNNDCMVGAARIRLNNDDLLTCYADFFRNNYAKKANWKVSFRLNGKVISKANAQKLV